MAEKGYIKVDNGTLTEMLKTFTADEVLLYYKLKALCNKQDSFATDEYLANYFNCTVKTVQVRLKKLETKGLIIRYYDGKQRRVTTL